MPDEESFIVISAGEITEAYHLVSNRPADSLPALQRMIYDWLQRIPWTVP